MARAASTAEESYYPAIRTLLQDLLQRLKLPFEARVATRETRHTGGADRPDLALYDGAGDYAVALIEVKLPPEDLQGIALSTDGGDQIGRYLSRTGIVIVSNVRAFALVTTRRSEAIGPVPPEEREITAAVHFWTSPEALRQGLAPDLSGLSSALELVEDAVTRFAPIAEPESLAKILARQARWAKAALPAAFTQATAGLLDDFGKALGVTFEGEEGEEFFRSSLIQTVFYAVFAAWAVWNRSGRAEEFRWEDLGRYLKIPFLGGLFHELSHPHRIRELGLRPHLDRAAETLQRVDVGRFYQRFQMASLTIGDQEEARSVSNAITYFYEPFLEAFDPSLRKELGVWYTPPEIVEYQARKVERLLTGISILAAPTRVT